MNDSAIEKVIRYLDEQLFEPSHYWPSDIFEERSYSRWAACEVIQRLMDQPFEQPDTIVEAFIFEMSMYAYVGGLSNRRMFSIARDAAEDILCLFI